MNEIEITPMTQNDCYQLSVMVGDLLNEIMEAIDERLFTYDRHETEKWAKNLLEKEKYWVLLAREHTSQSVIGFVSLYESYALYAEWAFGTIPELCVRPDWRSKNVGGSLLKEAIVLGKMKGWRRLEVTTSPLPIFERTLRFYQANGFEISGGRKLKANIDS